MIDWTLILAVLSGICCDQQDVRTAELVRLIAGPTKCRLKRRSRYQRDEVQFLHHFVSSQYLVGERN